MTEFKLVSSDGHVNEPPMAWERAQREYGDRAPKVVKDPPGVPKGTWLITQGLAPIGVSHFSIGLVIDKPEGVSAMDQAKMADTITFNEQWDWKDYPAGWDPAARLAAQDRDGVEAEVLFPSPGRFFYGLTDAALQRSIHRSYNAWLNEFCSYNRQRLVGVALLGVLDVDKTVEDIHEYAKLGFKAAQLPTGIKDSGYYEQKYDPIFQAAEETGIVLNVHTSATQGEQRTHFEGPREQDPRTIPLGFATRQAPAQRFMGHLIFSGVFDRHPNLKVVCAEFDVGWVSHIYQLADFEFGRSTRYDAERNANRLLPSEYMQRNVFFTFQDDRAGVLTTKVFGEDNFLWANDFPHGITTWPHSQRTVDGNFEGIDAAVKRKICRDNAIGLYGLDL
jgi:uncharacterized protein